MENNTTQQTNVYEKYKRKFELAQSELEDQRRSTKVTKVIVGEKIQDLLDMSKIKQNTRNKLKLSSNAPTWAKELNDNGN